MKLLNRALLLLFSIGNVLADTGATEMPDLISHLNSSRDAVAEKIFNGCDNVWLKQDEFKFDTRRQAWVHHVLSEAMPFDRENAKFIMEMAVSYQVFIRNQPKLISSNKVRNVECLSILCGKSTSLHNLDTHFVQCSDFINDQVRSNLIGTTWTDD